MKKLSYKNFNKGILVIEELKNAVIKFDWSKRVWAIKSEFIAFPTTKKRKVLLKKYKIDLTGLTTHKMKEENGKTK